MRCKLTVLTVLVGLLLTPLTALGQTSPEQLIPGPGVQRTFTLDRDHIYVFTCPDAPETAKFYAERLEIIAGPWYEYHSRGRYQPVYVPVPKPRGENFPICRGETDNTDQLVRLTSRFPDMEAAVFITSATQPTAAVADYVCGDADNPELCDLAKLAPGATRYAWLSPDVFKKDHGSYRNAGVAIHELGHLLNWPHTVADYKGSVYDTTGDVMSAGATGGHPAIPGGVAESSTSALNLYRSGWIDNSEVEIVDPEVGGDFKLAPTNGPDGATRLIAIPLEDGRYTYLQSSSGGLPGYTERLWEGVYLTETGEFPPYFVANDLRAFRFQPTWGDRDFSPWQLLPIVIRTGHGKHIGDTTVVVGSRVGDTFNVRIRPGHRKLPRFQFKDDDNQFQGQIRFLARAGISLGCNPPENDRFCPGAAVTRQQMASFLVRMLDLRGGDNPFTDVSDSNPHVRDIAALAKSGITFGCNPPTNDRYCPEKKVTRQEMASFLSRALKLEQPDRESPGSYYFRDVSPDNPHDLNIGNIAAWQITLGCNPPTNDRFCPNAAIKREEMAAFTRRGWHLNDPKVVIRR
ncbi:MAG: hypothetical protein GEU79_14530 [Acidimicrobiia bacterium]|nr:hypothetical protein [Acidimicrobiia bacterium]